MTTTADNAESGIVYILTNEAMPGYVKIGETKGDSSKDVLDRMRELDSTGVPRPFECVYAATVHDRSKVEKRLHTIFEKDRVRRTREFFEGAPIHSVKAALELAAVDDVTPIRPPETDAQGVVAPAKPPKRPRFAFSMVHIPTGTELTFLKDETKKCTIEDDRRVKYEGKVTALSPLTQELLGYATTPAGTDYWLYDGETLNERRRRLENEAAEND